MVEKMSPEDIERIVEGGEKSKQKKKKSEPAAAKLKGKQSSVSL
jgi:hypothetical protein